MEGYKEIIYEDNNEIKINMLSNLLKENNIKYIHKSEYYSPPKKVRIYIKTEDYKKANELINKNKLILNFKSSNNRLFKLIGIVIIVITILVLIFTIINFIVK